jgi:hypothetical protein
MKVQDEPIDHLPEFKNLVFAAVQLSEPALKEVTKENQDKEKQIVFEWDVVEREKRIQAAKDILSALFLRQVRKPDVIIFSEYSLPPKAFTDIAFQRLSDEHRCIIIAGSYFDEDPQSDYFCNNLSHTYLPGRAEPIVICKAEPSEEERKKIKSSSKLKNILRLVWQPAGAPPASINVFLCRDYLTPFESRAVVDANDPRPVTEHVSLLDWEREGINIVVMNNRESGPFEGQASLDIRLTHGKQKLVLFCNSANNENKLATTLIGVNTDRARVRDIAAQMPPASEGVLLIETQLCEVVGVKRFPDTRIDLPIHYTGRFQYKAGSNPCLTELTLPPSFPLKRGVFHPALLGALVKYIVIELFVARSSQKIEKAFEDRKIRHVSASHVRGIEDVLIKKYVEQHTWVKRTIPGLSVPHAYLSRKDFGEAFENGGQVPHAKFLIDPQKIIKFRSKEVPEQTPEEWDTTCEEFSRMVGVRQEALQQIISIATSIPPGGTIEEKYKRIFSLGEEEVVPLGKQFQNRETYLAIAVDPNEVNWLRDYIRTFLVKDDRIRDIYEVTDDEIRPETKRIKFSFLLRLKCTVFDTDEVIEALQNWAADRFRIGTRSYDIWRYIADDSITAIGDRISEAEMRFLNDLFDVDQTYKWFLRPAFREKFAHTIEATVRDIRKATTPEILPLQVALKRFFHNVCLYNIVDDMHAKRQCARDAKQSWLELYGYIENAARTLLTGLVGLPLDADAGDISKAIVLKLGLAEQGRKETNLVRLFGINYDALLGRAPSKLTERVRANVEIVGPVRNEAAHENPSAWQRRISLQGDGWEADFDELIGRVSILRGLIVDFAQEIDQRLGAC